MRRLPGTITRKLRRLERTFRAMVVVDAVAVAILVLLGTLAADFALDRFFEFSQAVRIVALAAMIVGLAGFVWVRIVRRVSAEVRPEQWAAVFERFVPELDGTLVTAVELAASPAERDALDADLMRQTVRHADQTLHAVRIRPFFRQGRLFGRVATAVSACAASVGLCVVFAEPTSIWFERNILLSERPWPRRSELVVDDFENGRVRIGRGDSFTLTVRANTERSLVPDTIRLRVGTPESGYRTILLDRFRVDTLDGVDWRTFAHTFTEMLETLPVQIRGADATIDGLLIEVVPPPVLSDIRIRQVYPSYLARPERTVSPSSRTTVPDGTSVTITAVSNKPLLEARVAVNRAEPVALHAADELRFELPELREETQLEFLLLDVDRLQNRRAQRLDVGIVKDQVPTVTARLDGIGSVATPTAVLPVLGEVTDDNGLAGVRFRYRIERAALTGDADAPTEPPTPEDGVQDIPGVGAARTVLALDRSFSLTEQNLAPGDKLSLRLEASDFYDLDPSESPRAGSGPEWALEIVTPERLRSLLEVREIALRQRFEVLIGEVERTKALLDELDLEPPEELAREAGTLSLAGDELTDADETRRRDELDARKKKLLETISRDQAATGLYNISRALRDTQKEVYELRTLNESFRLIRREMVNNRIFSDDVRERMDLGIIEPIQALVDADFPETDDRVETLNRTLDIRDRPLREQAKRQRLDALEQFDRVLKKMLSIRDNMVSMESFNEAVEILRAIIRQQNQLHQETLDRKNRRLKDLLEP